jgi:anti-anti-sigma regulatory factor
LNKLRQAGGGLRMAGATGQVRDAFHVTRLDTIFNFDDNVEAALKALG